MTHSAARYREACSDDPDDDQAPDRTAGEVLLGRDATFFAFGPPRLIVDEDYAETLERPGADAEALRAAVSAAGKRA
jgi:hypothetical protein